MKPSKLKLFLIDVKSLFFGYSKADADKAHQLGFNSVEEEDLTFVIKRKWHEISWVFIGLAIILTIVNQLKSIIF